MDEGIHLGLAQADEAQHLAADLGWAILPVREHGKEPLTAHGVSEPAPGGTRNNHAASPS